MRLIRNWLRSVKMGCAPCPCASSNSGEKLNRKNPEICHRVIERERIGVPTASQRPSRLSAQRCTNEKSPPAPRSRITITNHYYLEEIGFDPQNRVHAASTCVRPRRLMAGSQTVRLRFPSPCRTGSFAFSATPQERSSRAASPIRAPTKSSAVRAQRCINPKPFPLAAPRITKEKDSHLSKIGFVPQNAICIPICIRGLRRRTWADRQPLSEPF
jgi:hypothetical protein